MSFRKASKKQSRLRMAIDGPAGAGKTYTSLRIAHALGSRIAVINTESGAIEKYLGESPDGPKFDFDIVDLPDFSPTRYTQWIQEAGRLNYEVLIIDSLSHAWAGVGGALELKDKKSGNSFTAWKDITPMHNQMIEAILRSPCHIIATMRTKMEYVLEDQIDPKTGAKKSVPRKIGMAPVQRAGMEYEFDVVADMDNSNTMTVSKTRCSALNGLVVVKPGVEIGATLKSWLEDGSAIDASMFAVDVNQLRSTQEMQAEQAEQSRRQAAFESRQSELLAMANAPAEPPVAAVEQPPFDTATSASRLITLEQKNELVSLGAEIGVTPQQINESCKKKLGVSINEVPFDKASALVQSFRQMAEKSRAEKKQ